MNQITNNRDENIPIEGNHIKVEVIIQYDKYLTGKNVNIEEKLREDLEEFILNIEKAPPGHLPKLRFLTQIEYLASAVEFAQKLRNLIGVGIPKTMETVQTNSIRLYPGIDYACYYLTPSGKPELYILNGTDQPGLARRIVNKLKSHRSVKELTDNAIIGNAVDRPDQTTIYSSEENTESTSFLKKIDSVRGGRSADPLIGVIIFAAIFIIGAIIMFMFLR